MLKALARTEKQVSLRVGLSTNWQDDFTCEVTDKSAHYAVELYWYDAKNAVKFQLGIPLKVTNM